MTTDKENNSKSIITTLKKYYLIAMEKFLYPALFVMNKLPFKAKIIVSILILSMLLLFPSRTIFLSYYAKANTYDKRVVGLEYIEAINSLIKTVQEHRSLTKKYLEGDSNLKEEIIENENRFYLQKKSIMDLDVKRLNLLTSNKKFSEANSLFPQLTPTNLDAALSNEKIFLTHSQIIDQLIESILNISKNTTFSSSRNIQLSYLADMLQYKLPYLYEFTLQLQDISSGEFSQNEIMHKQKLLFKLSTNLSSLKIKLKENLVLSQLNNYPLLENDTISVTFKLENLLDIINNDIVNNQHSTFNNPSFLKQTKHILADQEQLYSMFIDTYKEKITELKRTLQDSLSSIVSFFLAIIIIALYIFVAFYQSITRNLKKLQSASELISSGQTKIKLQVDKKDEIGNALLAFNTMSERLDENISFLDGYKTAIDNSSIVSKTDLKGIITYANKMFCNVSGYTEEELIGRAHNIIRHPDMPKSAFKDMWQTIQAKRVWKGVVKNRTKDGGEYIVNATVLPILNRDGQIIEYVAVRHDITELERSKEEIRKQRTDLLTGLPNRNQLVVDLKKAVKPILFYLNIDDFSGFNEFYGSDIGDSVLIHIAEILGELKEQKFFELYKLQSDQFILLFQEGYLAQNNFQLFFEKLIEKIEDRIGQLQLENQNRISISVTSGAASYYAHDNYQNLILYANLARKKAQESHKKFLLFDHSMRKSEDYAKNIEWINKIKEAIEEARVVTYFQPIIDNKTSKVVKYETLVRMLDREGVPVPTWTFLEIAQKAKLYPQVTKIVIDKAFKAFEDFPQYEFSINLTIDDISSKEITNYICDKLRDYPTTERVIFEITESEEVRDYAVINNFTEGLKKYGVKIAIDDFGSGYANFEHIMNIDADFIKIDGSLIKNLDTDKNAYIITEAIISFSKKLGRKTITEYIHNEEIFKIVKELGADYSQGFYFGAPSPEIK